MAKEDHRWMLETGKLSDFKLICRGKEIHVHKIMLASHSKYFETFFNSSFKVENIYGVIYFEDVEPEVMRHLLDYFYKGTTDWKAHKADLVLHVRLWDLANRLEALKIMLTIEKRMMTALWSYKSKPLAMNLIDLVFTHPRCAGSALGYIVSEAAWILYIDTRRPDAAAWVTSALSRYHNLSNLMVWWSARYAKSSSKHGIPVLSINTVDVRSKLIEGFLTKIPQDPAETWFQPEAKP
ncbi:BTB/POZ domain-containing protein [Colletotrichum nymphaeae SA-01]|uniref:BTB/POZ domain-containing protein n=1 Tax=Colletotrichum nymphaeae SA-01 TaxID=1460502 RepID=A0A135S4F1_9PEZI|nr:BTB/POZ domain-containing protein [Colletotrichum nymphaeae SA-01]